MKFQSVCPRMRKIQNMVWDKRKHNVHDFGEIIYNYCPFVGAGDRTASALFDSIMLDKFEFSTSFADLDLLSLL